MLAPLVNLKYLDLTGSYVTDNGLKYLLPFTELEDFEDGEDAGSPRTRIE